MEKYQKNSIENRIKRLEAYLERLKGVEALEKIKLLKDSDEVKLFFASNGLTGDFFEKFTTQEQIIFLSLILIGQESILLALFEMHAPLDDFLNVLLDIDRFYETSDGLIVYQINILKLIEEEKNHLEAASEENYLKPPLIDLTQDSKAIRELVRIGIENLDQITEIYPAGGAGDRLDFTDEKTKKPLPVALLPFLGRSLLDGLIRDLEAKEYLFFKLHKKQLITPVAIMTSNEKNNHQFIEELCLSANWFNRSQNRFFLFSQPMVPVVTESGEWLLSSKMQLLLKPSGHGVIWKLASEKGVFDWCRQLGKSKMMSRQINNPVAGVDYGLLGFIGAGFKGQKDFGFASCDRFVNSSEGMDVLVEKQTAQDFEYKITNVEYTEFLKKGIKDEPVNEESSLSKFPANTNILFLDTKRVESAIKKCPIPGMLVNMKTTVPYIDPQGSLTKVKVGRLESTMQNIADEIVNPFPTRLKEDQYRTLSSYITFNERKKTISVTKKSLCEKNAFLETPESCFYDLLYNYHTLFSNYCHIQLPHFSEPEDYLKNGPSVILQFHPALGPLYSIIAQKIRGGIFHKNAELQLEIAELEIENLELDGSLMIEASNTCYAVDETGLLEYGKALGKCTLKNVKVKNLGVDRNAKNCYWKNEIKRLEVLRIRLQGDAEFVAEDVTFEGHFELEVKDGQRLRVRQGEEGLQFVTEELKESERGRPYWSYAYDEEDRIVLTRV